LQTQSAKTIFPNKQPLVRPAIRETTSTRGNQTTAEVITKSIFKETKRNRTEKHKKNCQNKCGTISEPDQEPIDLVLQGKIEKQAPTSGADSYSSLL
jgi:hypothetical protein